MGFRDCVDGVRPAPMQAAFHRAGRRVLSLNRKPDRENAALYSLPLGRRRSPVLRARRPAPTLRLTHAPTPMKTLIYENPHRPPPRRPASFFVSADGRGVEMDALKRAVRAIGLRTLEGLRDELEGLRDEGVVQQ